MPAPSEIETFRWPGLPAGLPFSSAVRVGDTVYVSGQIGHRPGGMRVVAGGIVPETRQALENLRAVLELGGSSLDRVVKCTMFLADMADYRAMNEVYAGYFPTDPPARSALAAKALALGARVELECIALVRP